MCSQAPERSRRMEVAVRPQVVAHSAASARLQTRASQPRPRALRLLCRETAARRAHEGHRVLEGRLPLGVEALEVGVADRLGLPPEHRVHAQEEPLRERLRAEAAALRSVVHAVLQGIPLTIPLRHTTKAGEPLCKTLHAYAL